MIVLYLSEWYPHRYDAMSGLFVRKHAAAAVRAGVEVCVLYFLKDEKAKGQEIVEQTTDGIREIYVYYSGSWLRAMRTGWAEVQKRWGRPDVTQVNVLTKNALLAYWLKKKYGIPYVLIEHWSGYLPENRSFKGGLRGRMMRHIAEKASCIAPVSEALEKGMKECGIRNAKWVRIHNVVDDFFFEKETAQEAENKEDKTFRFLHVSCFDERAKNVTGILTAVKKLSQERTDFELVAVGTGADFEAAKELSDKLELTDRFVFFKGEQTPEEVKRAMDGSDCFVLFSRYETAGVVLAECLACGLPMIGTRAGAIAEVINGQNGLLVESENTDALCDAMNRMISEAAGYDRSAIREAGKAYSEENVGAHLKEIYEKYAI